MPQLIEHIDAIARAKGRDVLMVIFHHRRADKQINWEGLPIRQQIIDWLDAHAIQWKPCAHFANTNMMCGYRGQIYIDVPFDEGDPRYRMVRDYLEKPDGSALFEDAMFCFCPLSDAMKNAHHDEPGFWEKWAEDF